jgi:site-specific DNA-methyltransferase (adenine-specific)
VTGSLSWNNVHQGDSDRDLLPRLLDSGERVDLILTDPPYNLGKDFGNKSDALRLDDFLEVNRGRLTIGRDLLASDGSLLWFATHHYVGFLQAMMYELGLHYRRMNIWRYENGFSRYTTSPQGEYEPFLWFSKSNERWTYNGDDVRVPYKSTERLRSPVFYKGANGERKAWHPHPEGRLRGDVWEFPTLAGRRFAKERTGHPTQKPLSLFLELLKSFCPKDEEGRYHGAVLDPYAGSGTLPVACEILNHQGHRIRWMAFELEEKWVDVANSRLASVTPTLFSHDGDPELG